MELLVVILTFLMEINEPEKGIFKGIGKLEVKRFANRKFFPNIRNINQF